MRSIIAKIKAKWQALDPKLKATIVSAGISWATAKYGAALDADTSALITLVVSSFIGYNTSNEGSALRAGNFDSGNPERNPEETPVPELAEGEVE